MPQSQTARFGFRIRTRSGAVVDNLLFLGQDESDAERKLRQIYVGCEILESRRLRMQASRSSALSFENIVDLLAEPGTCWSAQDVAGKTPGRNDSI